MFAQNYIHVGDTHLFLLQGKKKTEGCLPCNLVMFTKCGTQCIPDISAIKL